jgi:hypothetical protein
LLRVLAVLGEHVREDVQEEGQVARVHVD